MKSLLKRLALTTCVVFLISFEIIAQFVKVDSTSNWKKLFRAGVNLNQASFSYNWKPGGVNSIGFSSLLNFKANYKKGLTSFDNAIDLLYGMVSNDGLGYRKTTDRIYIDTKYGQGLNEKWEVFLSGNFMNQFAKGYSYKKDSIGVERATLISDFFAPAFLTVALGLEYHPVPYFKVRFAPLAPRITIVNDVNRFITVDDPKPYGVNPGERERYEWFAGQILAEFDKDIVQNLNLKMRYLMFANYETLALETVDHRLEVSLSAKVNKFINVSIGSILVYDYDQSLGAQIGQAFSFGMLYSMQNFEDK